MHTPTNHTNYEHDQSLHNQLVNPSPRTLSNHSDNGLHCSKPKAVFGMQSCPTPSIESLTKSIYSNLLLCLLVLV